MTTLETRRLLQKVLLQELMGAYRNYQSPIHTIPPFPIPMLHRLTPFLPTPTIFHHFSRIAHPPHFATPPPFPPPPTLAIHPSYNPKVNTFLCWGP